ncbi:MAG TPA: hypothetical protein VKT80_09595 [Chloroflexota bacterium]|nr:hypothetical protein [Chloroflexota bacterium]
MLAKVTTQDGTKMLAEFELKERADLIVWGERYFVNQPISLSPGALWYREATVAFIRESE